MVGLSDIPCVGKIVDRISDATVEALFRGLHYMFCYKNLVNDLNSKIGELNIEEGRVSRKADEERANGKILENHVLKWQCDVQKIQMSATELSEIYKNRPSWRCIRQLPIPNPFSRFQLGRKVVQKAKSVTELTHYGKELLANEIGYLPPHKNVPKLDSAFQNFQSREDAYGKLWEMLVTEDSPLILGIYGMPGVGKTRMMEQLWEDAKEKKIFDKVTRANVGSEKLDVIKLQNQIAGHLNCHLESQNVEHRDSQLKNSLRNGGNILIILDDVWSTIRLEDIIGTSFGDGSSSKGSKILLTSRTKDVCFRNKCRHPVEIRILTEVEALGLFTNIVGTNYIDPRPKESLVQQVCNKCAGLPLLLCAVGKALQFASHHIWRDALYKLNHRKIKSVPVIGPEVYACLKLSFDNLVKDAKLCLLPCSLFPEDADIPVRRLIQLATGSQLVHGGSVHAMVDILKSSSLLLESRYDEHFKLHDIIRDVTRYIAIGETEYAFLFARCGSRLPDGDADYGTRKLLHLDLEKNDFHFPDDLVCPDLYTLLLQSSTEPCQADPLNSISCYVERFSSVMFGNLTFLVLENFGWQWQLSLQHLGKLRTLYFDKCDIRYIGQTDASFFPQRLESLCIWRCLLPSPLDLSNLKYLRKLEIHENPDETMGELHLVPNTICSLSSLEELHIPNGFRILDGAIKRPALILNEISKLTRLTSLEFLFRDFDRNLSSILISTKIRLTSIITN